MAKIIMKKLLLLNLLFCFSIFAQDTTLTSKSVALAWNANTEPELAGYIIKIGKKSKEWTDVYDVGKVTQWETPKLGLGYWYTAAFAYDGTKLESPPSEEISIHIRRVLTQTSFNNVDWALFSDNVFSFSDKSESAAPKTPVISSGRTQKFFRYYFMDEIPPVNNIPSVSAFGIYLQWDPPSPSEKILGYKVYQDVNSQWVLKDTIYPPSISFLVPSSGVYSISSFNLEKGESLKSNSMNIFLNVRPLAPKNLRIKN